MRSRTILPLLSAAAVVAFLSSCTSGPIDTESASFESSAIRDVPTNGNSADWVTWDPEGCTFTKAVEHDDEWKPQLRATMSPFLIGFGAQDTTNEVNITMNKSMEESAADTGADLAMADYKFPSTSEPASAARSITAREPAVVVSNNQIDELLQSVNGIYSDACVPVIQVVTPAEGTILFGPSNADMGALQGERLIDFAHQEGWTADQITLMTTYYSPAGPEVAKRASVCAETVEEAFPGVTSVEHDTTSTTSLELQNKFTDLVTANPDAEKILVCTVADLWALADANALQLAGKQADSAVTGVNGGTAVLDAIDAGDSPLVGTVDLGSAQWGDYWIALAEDIASGEAVPTEVFAPISVLPKDLPSR